MYVIQVRKKFMYVCMKDCMYVCMRAFMQLSQVCNACMRVMYVVYVCVYIYICMCVRNVLQFNVTQRHVL